MNKKVFGGQKKASASRARRGQGGGFSFGDPTQLEKENKKKIAGEPGAIAWDHPRKLRVRSGRSKRLRVKKRTLVGV